MEERLHLKSLHLTLVKCGILSYGETLVFQVRTLHNRLLSHIIAHKRYVVGNHWLVINREALNTLEV